MPRLRHYWRRGQDGGYHCFVKYNLGGYISLCERFRSVHSGGQTARRPPPLARCARCDCEEIIIAGVDESLPEDEDWQ